MSNIGGKKKSKVARNKPHEINLSVESNQHIISLIGGGRKSA